MYIFLDESGNFSKNNDGEYFVIGSFTVGDQRRTNKEFKKWLRTKFPKRMQKQNEIKWSTSGLSHDLRLRTLQHIANLDVRIKYGFLSRKNIPSHYRNKKNKIHSGILYTNIVGEVLEQYLPTNHKEVHIFCDQRSLKNMTRQQFENDIVTRLLPYCSSDCLVQVEMIDSAANGNMQIVDWISGAIARYLEKGEYGEEYFKVLKNNFLGEGKEFFSN